MEYTKKEISEMQGMMRGAADVNVQVEILAQIYGGSADDICAALGIPFIEIPVTPNMARRGWTEQTIATIREMRREGKTIAAISKAVGLSLHAIDNFFRRHRGIFPEMQNEVKGDLYSRIRRRKRKAAHDVSASKAAEISV